MFVVLLGFYTRVYVGCSYTVVVGRSNKDQNSFSCIVILQRNRKVGGIILRNLNKKSMYLSIPIINVLDE